MSPNRGSSRDNPRPCDYSIMPDGDYAHATFVGLGFWILAQF